MKNIFNLTLKLPVLLILLILLIFANALFAETKTVLPFESKSKKVSKNKIDTLVTASLKKKGIKPANLCSDEVFIRRVYLDVTGTLPNGWQVRKFISDRSPKKREKLIDILLKSDEYADYWSLKWGDLLRVKAEFPINLWPNAVQAYHRWIHDSIKNNKPYDKFASELLTSSGSNFRVPQVNFYRAVQGRDPASLASAAALTFMGVRLDKCSEEDRKNMEVFFSRVAYKKTAEWKEEIVYLDMTSAKPINSVLPGGDKQLIDQNKDPRKIFTEWLITPENPWFSRNIVNRIWSWLLGRGIIHEPDDIRQDNPPVHPELLKYLETEFVKSKYDLKHIYRIILNSHTYQQSSIPATEHKDAEALFACYPVRRLDAEVLIDALCKIFGGSERYSSQIPEPFTFIPEEHRSIELADGSISSQFLEMFGRPPRDTGLESERNNNPTDAQRLHMLNSSHIQDKIRRSKKLRNMLKGAKGNKQAAVTILYLNIMSRYPTKEELAAISKYSKKKKGYQATNDLIWALINTKEFQFRH